MASTHMSQSPPEAANSNLPLPPEIHRVLKEVATTGKCTWLCWAQESQQNTSLDRSRDDAVGAVRRHVRTGFQSPSDHHASTTAKRSSANSLALGRSRKKGGVSKPRRGRFTSTEEGKEQAPGSRKRPLGAISKPSNSPLDGFPGSVSVGSGRTSSSEPDDSTQYECDSEGTSTTTNSDISVERPRDPRYYMGVHTLQSSDMDNIIMGNGTDGSSQCRTLREAFRIAVSVVLDHFYKNRGGYKLSPAEERRIKFIEKQNHKDSTGRSLSESAKDAFFLRRQKLIEILEPRTFRTYGAKQAASFGPPFTIQRVAEVLVAPHKYYTQTHKLCNCLEKLLLVASSRESFGGSTGGDTSQSRLEERELAALAEERNRQESEIRHRRFKRRTASALEGSRDYSGGNGHSSDESCSEFAGRSSDTNGDNDTILRTVNDREEFLNSGEGSNAEMWSNREKLEAAARASLRTKFDHVGIDPHSAIDREVRSIADSRHMTNSPPPPSLAMSAAASNIALQGHVPVSGFVRQHLTDQTAEHHSIARVPSPIPFASTSDSQMQPNTNMSAGMHMLPLHHAVALAGISLGRQSASPLDLMTIDAGIGSTLRSIAPGVADGADFEVEHGRSSASNSDVDSESDDVSFDDSASDRSDGSDSGSAVHHEPFTAARAMALNRMQQQQRLQSRALTSLTSLHQSEHFRPPADSEYQSGDSIDSMRAEDSGGSDSSSQSSDIAD